MATAAKFRIDVAIHDLLMSSGLRNIRRTSSFTPPSVK